MYNQRRTTFSFYTEYYYISKAFRQFHISPQTSNNVPFVELFKSYEWYNLNKSSPLLPLTYLHEANILLLSIFSNFIEQNDKSCFSEILSLELMARYVHQLIPCHRSTILRVYVLLPTPLHKESCILQMRVLPTH